MKCNKYSGKLIAGSVDIVRLVEVLQVSIWSILSISPYMNVAAQFHMSLRGLTRSWEATKKYSAQFSDSLRPQYCVHCIKFYLHADLLRMVSKKKEKIDISQ